MKILPAAAAAVALAFSAGSALAADLPNRKGPPVFAPPPPLFSWTGFYGGINIGGAFGNSDAETGSQIFFPVPTIIPVAGIAAWSLPLDFQGGVVGGGQIGFNYQFSPMFVVGVEADMQGTNLDAGATGTAALVGLPAFGTIFNSNHFVDWFGTVRGRIGVTPFLDGRLLIYGTGGFAYGRVIDRFSKIDFDVPATGSVFGNAECCNEDVRTGWTAGGGVEWAPAFLPNISAKVEYLFVDLGSATILVPGVLDSGAALPVAAFFVGEDHVRTRFHVVRAGVNYHVNFFGPAPIAASY